jgi:hypothetical protein
MTTKRVNIVIMMMHTSQRRVCAGTQPYLPWLQGDRLSSCAPERGSNAILGAWSESVNLIGRCRKDASQYVAASTGLTNNIANASNLRQNDSPIFCLSSAMFDVMKRSSVKKCRLINLSLDGAAQRKRGGTWLRLMTRISGRRRLAGFG